MTKYSDANRKYIPRPDTPIPISSSSYDDDNEDKTYYCKYCNRNLVWLRDSSGANADRTYYCTFCSITSYPDETTRRKGKLTTRTEPPEEPAVTLLPERGLKRKTVEYKGGFAQLSKKGTLRITDYKEGKG